MTTKKKLIIIIASLIVGIAAVIGAVVATSKSGPKLRTVSKAELKASNGKNGKPCFVALSGVVYQIPQSLYWRDGKHVPSEGQAYCGADLTSVISKSPHGTSTLSRTTKIGPLGE